MSAVWQEFLTPILALAGIGGTLGGVYIGQRMAQKWQREQWVLDNRKEEFRELLDALSESLRVEMKLYTGLVMSSQEEQLLVETHSNTMRVIRSRIFVADLANNSQFEMRWAQALKDHQFSLDVAPLAATYSKLRMEIIRAALSG
ncbi:MAG TPA: hypothetical protein VK814_04600 [Acidobacteriaceae bacterium]|jgi:hypothetical protein|nr:hypothetical protein [Acidobacteriaceae bacterium]